MLCTKYVNINTCMYRARDKPHRRRVVTVFSICAKHEVNSKRSCHIPRAPTGVLKQENVIPSCAEDTPKKLL